MNIRLLNDEDVEMFRALHIEAVNESPRALAESIAEITEKSIADFVHQLQPHGRGDFVFGAFDDAHLLIGVVGFYRTVHAKQSHKGTLWGMYVTPARRQQGIGCALVAAAIEHARNLPGMLYILLSVTTSNEAARRLYESQGFQLYGIEQKAIHVDGVYFDEALMQLWLPQEPLPLMRRRPSSRLLVIDQNDRLLLFRFVHKAGVLAGKDYWATPGGALEEDETFVNAARRELFEETGIAIETIGEHIAEREFVLQTPEGENVIAQERFFVVRTTAQNISKAHWTPEEVNVVADYKWWLIQELITTPEVIFPENIVAILRDIGLSECREED